MDRNGDGAVVECRIDTLEACADNELGFMLHKRNIWSSDPAPFTNLKQAWYWSTDPNPYMEPRVFVQYMGAQNQDTRGNAHPESSTPPWGWAVISGDVAVVPVPAAVWLFASGLLGLVGFARRKRVV